MDCNDDQPATTWHLSTTGFSNDYSNIPPNRWSIQDQKDETVQRSRARSQGQTGNIRNQLEMHHMWTVKTLHGEHVQNSMSKSKSCSIGQNHFIEMVFHI